VHRRRFQRGCVRKVRSGRKWVWIGKYYEDKEGKTTVLGPCARMTQGEAAAKLQEILRPINEGLGRAPNLPTNFKAYVHRVFVPHKRKLWKESSSRTTIERIDAYLMPALEAVDVREMTRERLQRLLDRSAEHLSRSVIDHLRWDLKSILELAVNDGLMKANPAGSLVTPKWAKTTERPVMTKSDYSLGLSVLDLRERIVYNLAGLAGLRPGEIFALRWAKVGQALIEVAERVYCGLLDTPKTARGRRDAALPPDLAADLEEWRRLSPDSRPEALVFPSERGTFLARDNFLRRNLQTKLAKVGLDWVNFQVLRRTQASVGHMEHIDPKVMADQRGHGIGVAVDVYTRSDVASRREAVSRLEAAMKGGKSKSAEAA
jgi:integrase